MVRVKIIKGHKKYSVGETVEVTRNEAHGLIDSGIAMLSKDMTAGDYTIDSLPPVKKTKRIRRYG